MSNGREIEIARRQQRGPILAMAIWLTLRAKDRSYKLLDLYPQDIPYFNAFRKFGEGSPGVDHPSETGFERNGHNSRRIGELNGDIAVTDLYDAENNPAGTKVVLRLRRIKKRKDA